MHEIGYAHRVKGICPLVDFSRWSNDSAFAYEAVPPHGNNDMLARCGASQVTSYHCSFKSECFASQGGLTRLDYTLPAEDYIRRAENRRFAGYFVPRIRFSCQRRSVEMYLCTSPFQRSLLGRMHPSCSVEYEDTVQTWLCYCPQRTSVMVCRSTVGNPSWIARRVSPIYRHTASQVAITSFIMAVVEPAAQAMARLSRDFSDCKTLPWR